MELTLDWVIVELAFVVATAFLGFLVGWKYMAIWTVGVFFSTLVADKIGPVLQTLINKFLSVGAQFVAIGTGRDESSVSSPEIIIPEAWQPLAVAVFFLFLVLFSSWIASKLGNAIDVGLLGKILGAVFGALGTILALSKVSEYYQQFVATNGSDPLAGNLALSIPTITLGFSGSAEGQQWTNLGSLAIALFLMILVLYTIWRVVRKVIF